MKYHYQVGSVRWTKVVSGDPRAHATNKGWTAFAYQLEEHPITGKPFKEGYQWWIKETYKG